MTNPFVVKCTMKKYNTDLKNCKYWLTDPSRTGLYLFLAILLFLVIFAISIEAKPQEPVDPTRIEKAIKWWGRAAPLNPVLRPEKLRPLCSAIAESSAAYNLPWQLVTAIVLRESSGHATKAKVENSKGGELGEMQVHPGNVKRFECDMSTVSGRVNCGCKVLDHNVDQCGTLTGGVTRYASKYRVCRATPGTHLSWVVKDRFDFAKRLERASHE